MVQSMQKRAASRKTPGEDSSEKKGRSARKRVHGLQSTMGIPLAVVAVLGIVTVLSPDSSGISKSKKNAEPEVFNEAFGEAFDKAFDEAFGPSMEPKETPPISGTKWAAKKGQAAQAAGKQEKPRTGKMPALVQQTAGNANDGNPHTFCFAGDNSKVVLRDAEGAALDDEACVREFGGHGGQWIRAGGLDVTSAAYARRLGLPRPLELVAQDLSDQAGWPNIEVRPDSVAVDPRSGRIKFYEGNDGPIEKLGSVPMPCYQPSDFIVHGDLILSATGEGNHPFPIHDISDPEHVKEAFLFPPEEFSRLAWALAVAAHRNIGYFGGTNPGLLIGDITDPYHPKLLHQWKPPEEEGLVRCLAVKDNLLFIGLRRAPKHDLLVVDMSTPSSPKVLGKADTLPGQNIDRLWLRGHELFAKAREGGMAIIDISSPAAPRTIRFFSKLSAIEASPEIDDIVLEDENEAYPDEILFPLGMPSSRLAVMAGRPEGSDKPCTAVHFVDITKREKPVLLATYAEEENRSFLPNGAVVRGNRVYIADGGSWGRDDYIVRGCIPRIVVLDVSDRKSPRECGAYVSPDPGRYLDIQTHPDHPNRLFVRDKSMGVWIFDVTDPDKPKRLDGCVAAGEGGYGLVDGKVAYGGTTCGPVWAYDVSDPARPKRFSRCYFDGMFCSRSWMYKQTDRLYVAKPGVVAVVDVAKPGEMKKCGIMEIGRGRFVIADKRLFVLRQDQTKKIAVDVYDIGASSLPQRTHTFNMRDALHRNDLPSFAIQDDLLYAMECRPKEFCIYRMPEGAGRLEKVGMADCSEIVAEKPGLEGSWKLQVIGERAYVNGNGAVLDIFDVSDPARPRHAGRIPPGEKGVHTWQGNCWMAEDFQVVGDYAYVAFYRGVSVYDVSDPARTRVVAHEPQRLEYDKTTFSLGQVQGEILYTPRLGNFTCGPHPAFLAGA